MPMINRPAKKPKVTKAKKLAKKPIKKPVSRALVKAKTAKIKNTLAYYQCMCHQTQQGLKGKKITSACHDCKHNALTINAKMSAVKMKAAQKIQAGYQTMGQGLAELIAASK
jgi:hypothetical protein